MNLMEKFVVHTAGNYDDFSIEVPDVRIRRERLPPKHDSLKWVGLRRKTS